MEQSHSRGWYQSRVDFLASRIKFRKLRSTNFRCQPTLLALGLTREWVSGSDLVQKIANDIAKWRDVIVTANIHAVLSPTA